MSPARRLLVALAILGSAAGAEALYFLRGLSLHHFNSVSAIPIYLLKLFRDNLLAGSFLPLTWTKTILTGVPLPGGVASYDPFFIPLALLFNLPDAVVAHDIALRALGGAGMYCYLRHVGLSFPVALTAAAIFCANVYYAANGQDPQFGAIICWMPWLALVLSCILEGEGSKPLQALLLGLALALAFLTTNMQYMYFLTLFLILQVALAHLYTDGAPGLRLTRTWFVSALAIATGYLLFLLLVAFEIVPSMDNLITSRRDIESPQRYILLAFIMAGAHWSIRRILKHGRRGHLVALTLLVLTLMGFALWRAGFPPVPLRYLPTLRGLEGFRFDAQYLPFLLTLPQAALALVGLGAMRANGRAAPVLVLGLAFFSYKLMNVDYGYIYRAFFVPVFCLSVLVAFGLEEALRKLSVHRPRLARLAPALCLLLVVEHFGMYFLNTIFSPSLAQTAVVTSETTYLAGPGKAARTAWTYRSHKEALQSAADPTQPVLLEWLFSGYHGARPFCFSGISVLPNRLEEFAKLAYPKFFGANADRPGNNLLDVAGVRLVLSPLPLEYPESQDLRLAIKGGAYHIYENTARLPRLRLVSSLSFLPARRIPAALAAADKRELLDLAFTDDITRYTTADAGKNTGVTATDEAFRSDRGAIVLTEDAETRTRITCAIAKESFLILADTYYPGWTARFNGHEVPLIQVNGAFIGVRLPVGSGDLVLEFAPRLWKRAMWVSVGAWIVALAGLLLLLTRRGSCATPP